MANEKLISVKAAARALNVREESLRHEIDQGTLPHVRVGDDVLVVLADVEQALVERARTTTPTSGQGVQHG